MLGINLSGAEFGNLGGKYGWSYIYPSASDLDFYAQRGVELVRLPVRWERLQPTAGGALDPDELGRLNQFLADAKTAGVKVIVDVHNFGSYYNAQLGSDGATTAQFADFWQKLAGAIGTQPALTGYDLMNEPHDLPSGVWPAAAQAAVDAIRKVDGTHSIYVEGEAWANSINWSTTNASLDIKDPVNKIIYEAHIYFDRYTSGTYQGTYDSEGAYADIGADRIKDFTQWLADKNAKGFIGEFAVPDNDPRWLTVLDKFAAALDAAHLDGTYWGAGPWWGDYPLALRNAAGAENPQLAVLEKYFHPDEAPAGPTVAETIETDTVLYPPDDDVIFAKWNKMGDTPRDTAGHDATDPVAATAGDAKLDHGADADPGVPAKDVGVAAPVAAPVVVDATSATVDDTGARGVLVDGAGADPIEKSGVDVPAAGEAMLTAAGLAGLGTITAALDAHILPEQPVSLGEVIAAKDVASDVGTKADPPADHVVAPVSDVVADDGAGTVLLVGGADPVRAEANGAAVISAVLTSIDDHILPADIQQSALAGGTSATADVVDTKVRANVMPDNVAAPAVAAVVDDGAGAYQSNADVAREAVPAAAGVIAAPDVSVRASVDLPMEKAHWHATDEVFSAGMSGGKYQASPVRPMSWHAVEMQPFTLVESDIDGMGMTDVSLMARHAVAMSTRDYPV